MRRSPGAFTLVELLVVVTIIVVLLSLLLPAMGKAIYQANLAKCGANFKMLATSSHLYAHDNKRFYPHRDLPEDPDQEAPSGVQPHKLLHTGRTASGKPGFDLRPMLRPYAPIQDVFNDPFCEPLDYDRVEVTQTTTSIYTSIFYWAGWYYPGRPGMFKVGDTFEAEDFESNFKPVTMRVLAGDADTAEGHAYSSHPDNKVLVNRLIDTPAWIESNWFGANQQFRRGLLDMNFAYEDGAVIRKTHVDNYEEDMIRISNFNLARKGQTHVPSN